MTEETAQQQPADTASQPQAQASELQPGQAPADGGAANAGDGAQPNDQQQPVETQEEQDKKRQRFDKRFSDLTQRARNAELEAARLRGENEALRRLGVQPQQQPAPQAPAAPAGPPDPNDKAKYPGGKWDDNYIVDLAVHRFEQKQAQEREQASAREREAAEQAVAQEGRKRLDATIKQARSLADQGAHTENASAVLDLAFVPIDQGGLPRHVVDGITESANAVHVAELLGRDPQYVHESLRDVAEAYSLDKLRAMTPTQALRAIAAVDFAVGRVLAAHRANAPQPAPKPAPTPSPAAMPTAPARGGAAPIDPEKGSMDDYVRWRTTQAH